jgi:hypothetical protein
LQSYEECGLIGNVADGFYMKIQLAEARNYQSALLQFHLVCGLVVRLEGKLFIA